MAGFLVFEMPTSIELNGELGFGAIKVQDISGNWVLASKFGIMQAAVFK
jgi:hypothetical protein